MPRVAAGDRPPANGTCALRDAAFGLPRFYLDVPKRAPGEDLISFDQLRNAFLQACAWP